MNRIATALRSWSALALGIVSTLAAPPLRALNLRSQDISPFPGASWNVSALGDLDGDGRSELVVIEAATGATKILKLCPNGSVTTWATLQLPAPNVAYVPPFVRDMDGDGDADLVTWSRNNNQKGTLTIATNQGGGTFTLQSYPTPETDAGYQMGLGDIDGDGLPDVLTTDLGYAAPGVLYVLFNAPNGTRFTTSQSPAVPGGWAEGATAQDLDGDGDPDVLVSTHSSGASGVVLVWNQGGVLTSTTVLPHLDGSRSLDPIAVDVDGDGDLDIVTCTGIPNSYQNVVKVFRRGPGGTYGPEENLIAGAQPLSTHGADFDGDGRVDLVVDNSFDHTLGLFLGQPGGPGTSQIVYSSPELSTTHGELGRPQTLSVGDVDGDGDPDIVFSSDRVVVVWNGPPGPGCNLTLKASADSFLRQGAPNTNEGANEILRIQASGHNRVVAGFDLSQVSLQGLLRARLRMTIASSSSNWGPLGRLVFAHRLTSPWVEGNGWTVGGGTRGSGPGITWACATDAQISNQNDDCASGWSGGSFALPTAPPVLHTNGLTGTVEWDVTADVLLGAPYGWLLKKDQEGASGEVGYAAREAGAATAPALILEYQ